MTTDSDVDAEALDCVCVCGSVCVCESVCMAAGADEAGEPIALAASSFDCERLLYVSTAGAGAGLPTTGNTAGTTDGTVSVI